jgi:hypothetical protein
MWLNRASGTTGDCVVLGKFWNAGMSAPFYQYGLELDGGTTPHFYVGTPSGLTGARMSSTLPSGQWSHLAIVLGSGQVRFYLNGTLVTTVALTATISARGNELRIGADANTQQFYKGAIDDVRVYSRAQTQTEIQSDLNTSLQ